MNMETWSTWIQLKANLLFVILCTQLLLSDSSPLSENSRGDNSQVCSKGWVHYQRFCVMQAKGETDAAIALYCDGFGGVGINGYCITKAHNTDTVDNYQTSQESSASNLGHELWRVADKTAVAENTKLGELMDADSRVSLIDQQNVCPEGWTHYGKICVYQPISVTEQCHNLNAVAFSGLCLKHADMGAVEKRGLKQSAAIMDTQEKRICCCAHVRGKYNGYGCM